MINPKTIYIYIIKKKNTEEKRYLCLNPTLRKISKKKRFTQN